MPLLREVWVDSHGEDGGGHGQQKQRWEGCVHQKLAEAGRILPTAAVGALPAGTSRAGREHISAV